jgi:hypothetical protein
VQKISSILLLLGFILNSTGCSYRLRGTDREFFKQANIKTLYVAPVANNSYRPGVEIMLYNTIRKRIAQGGYVRIVDDRDHADGELKASVTAANSNPGAAIRAEQLAQAEVGAKRVIKPDLQIASNYSVNLGVSFSLIKTQTGSVIWSHSGARSKTFQASTYYGALGSTSALINDSQFETTLNELAVLVVTDAEESMNAFF